MRLESVTPLLITYNEEANLERVLDRLSWARRIVVVDSFSTDATLDILAEDSRVDVYYRTFESFADQCNFGLTKIETEWVLSLDADYVLADGFVEEMASLVGETASEADSEAASEADSEVAGYTARFTYCVDGTPLRASLYPPRTVLFRRAMACYAADGHAHRLQLDGDTAPINTRILHDDRKPIASWLDAQRRYAEHEAAKLSAASTPLGFVDRLRTKRWIAPLLTPLYCLFRKGLILDGPAGWLYTAQRTYAELLLTLYLSAEQSERGQTHHEDPTEILDARTPTTPHTITVRIPRAA